MARQPRRVVLSARAPAPAYRYLAVAVADALGDMDRQRWTALVPGIRGLRARHYRAAVSRLRDQRPGGPSHRSARPAHGQPPDRDRRDPANRSCCVLHRPDARCAWPGSDHEHADAAAGYRWCRADSRLPVHEATDHRATARGTKDS